MGANDVFGWEKQAGDLVSVRYDRHDIHVQRFGILISELPQGEWRPNAEKPVCLPSGFGHWSHKKRTGPAIEVWVKEGVRIFPAAVWDIFLVQSVDDSDG